MLEVCVDSLESAINAIKNGADELELCSSLPEGGLTPSPGLVRCVLHEINKFVKEWTSDEPPKRPKINIMIRCRGGNDFCYSDQEIITMLEDIKYYKTKDIDRFVFGALTPERNVHALICSKIIAEASPKPVTFHRAFDWVNDPNRAMLQIIELDFDRVLTSGQRESAADDAAIALLKKLHSDYSSDIEIMPGGGVTVDNVRLFIDNGFQLVHSSCKRPKRLPPNLSVGSSDANVVFVTDGDLVREMKRRI